MTDVFGSTDPAASEATIPTEGQRRIPGAGSLLTTERAAGAMVLGALVFLVFLRAAFKGALGD